MTTDFYPVSIRHLGPTAQDFRRAFGLGVDSRHIDSIDSEGVSLAGVKALYELVQARQREIDVLKKQVARLESRARGLSRRHHSIQEELTCATGCSFSPPRSPSPAPSA